MTLLSTVCELRVPCGFFSTFQSALKISFNLWQKKGSCTADFFSLPLLYQVVAGFGFYSNWCGGTQRYFIGLFIIWKNAVVAGTLIWL